MSTDRELLELAAKAVGYASLVPVPISRTECTYLVEMIDGGPLKPFNPLTDDGEALRLALAMPALDLHWLVAKAWQACDSEDERRGYVRRAIVQAVAEIGRAMP